jgi:hypothetical protein
MRFLMQRLNSILGEKMYDTNEPGVFQIITFCEWDDDETMDRLLKKAHSAGYDAELTYIMAAEVPEYLDRDMFMMAPKITYIFEDNANYSLQTLEAISALELKPEEMRWL